MSMKKVIENNLRITNNMKKMKNDKYAIILRLI